MSDARDLATMPAVSAAFKTGSKSEVFYARCRGAPDAVTLVAAQQLNLQARNSIPERCMGDAFRLARPATCAGASFLAPSYCRLRVIRSDQPNGNCEPERHPEIRRVMSGRLLRSCGTLIATTSPAGNERTAAGAPSTPVRPAARTASSSMPDRNIDRTGNSAVHEMS